jgi:hypothetical protein
VDVRTDRRRRRLERPKERRAVRLALLVLDDCGTLTLIYVAPLLHLSRPQRANVSAARDVSSSGAARTTGPRRSDGNCLGHAQLLPEPTDSSPLSTMEV